MAAWFRGIRQNALRAHREKREDRPRRTFSACLFFLLQVRFGHHGFVFRKRRVVPWQERGVFNFGRREVHLTSLRGPGESTPIREPSISKSRFFPASQHSVIFREESSPSFHPQHFPGPRPEPLAGGADEELYQAPPSEGGAPPRQRSPQKRSTLRQVDFTQSYSLQDRIWFLSRPLFQWRQAPKG